jgi:hypothetical protein
MEALLRKMQALHAHDPSSCAAKAAIRPAGRLYRLMVRTSLAVVALVSFAASVHALPRVQAMVLPASTSPAATGGADVQSLPGLRIIPAQAGPAATLPSLVLPPGASTAPPMYESLMRSGDAAMVRGDIMRARAFYERAAGIHPASSAAPVAVGKTYDPNLLPVFGGSSSMANAARAAEWYQRARDLGDPTAAALLASLR